LTRTYCNKNNYPQPLSSQMFLLQQDQTFCKEIADEI
jgi:hypothetical protein